MKFKKEPRLNIGEIGEKTGGIEVDDYVAEYLEVKAEELDTIFERIERTQQYDVNDRHHIDVFVTLKGGLPCAFDFAGRKRKNYDEGGLRLERKQNHQSVMSFKCRCDPKTEEPISEPMPFFVLDGLDLTSWINWGREANEQGVPITDVMPADKDKIQYRFIVGKMWEQVGKILKEGTNDQKKKIKLYKNALIEEYKKILSPEEQKILGIAV